MASELFIRRVLDHLLPEFCNDPTRGWGTQGFKARWDKVADIDGDDFLRALDAGLVRHVGRGQYRAARSAASEQFFWEGAKSVDPRPLTIWLEPVITVAVLGRLHFELGWPDGLIGAQSPDWAFDVVAYLAEGVGDEHIACEVKKTTGEVDQLISLMATYGEASDHSVPSGSKGRNAWKKVEALRRRRPPMFWAVGPGGYNAAFRITYGEGGRVTFAPCHLADLRFPGHR